MTRTLTVISLALLVGSASVAACSSDDTDNGGGGSGGTSSTTSSTSSTSSTSDTTSGSTSSTSTTSSTTGVGGSGPYGCVDLSTISPNVDFPPCNQLDQALCRCEGCTDDGICYDAGQELADDCVCPDCASNQTCTDPARCEDDGLCDPYWEGCQCADCANHPLCPYPV